MPPQPPHPNAPFVGNRYPDACAHNQQVQSMTYAHNMGYQAPQYRITPPGVMGPSALNWDITDTDTGGEPSEDTAPRRTKKRGHGMERKKRRQGTPKSQLQKRSVMLTIKGHQVEAHYWAP